MGYFQKICTSPRDMCRS